MNNETLPDILAEFRKFALRAAEEDKMISPESVLLLADKAEAAAQRERNRQYEPKCDWSLNEALALANTLANHGLRDGNADAASSCIYSLCRHLRAPGNAAALREALKAFIQLADDGTIQPRTKGHHDEHCFVVAQGMARAALSAPPRNCDRYRTEEEALKAWDGLDENDAGDWFAFTDWLFAPAKEASNG